MVYDATGTRILRQEANTTTLYLAGAEITLTDSGTQPPLQGTTPTVSALRYYTHAGQTLAVRTGASNDTITTLIPDWQGTTHHQVTNATGDLKTTWQDPYGNTRGTPPTTWTGERSFVGGTKDGTGLIRIGARDYDPTLQRFVTVDPVQDVSDPLQWNSYLYANNTPITKADPSGLCWICDMWSGVVRWWNSIRPTYSQRPAPRPQAAPRPPVRKREDAPKNPTPKKPVPNPKPNPKPSRPDPRNEPKPTRNDGLIGAALKGIQEPAGIASDTLNYSLRSWSNQIDSILLGRPRLHQSDQAWLAKQRAGLRAGSRGVLILGTAYSAFSESVYRMERYEQHGYSPGVARVLGAFAGVGVAFAANAAGAAAIGAGSETGPGAIATGVAGGYLGGLAASSVADTVDYFLLGVE